MKFQWGVDAPLDFDGESYFKNGAAAFEQGQGWKTMEALSPEIGEWMRFVLKQLSLKSHASYLAKGYRYVEWNGVQLGRFRGNQNSC